MLQFERKNHQSSAVNKTKNFLALNKSLVKAKSKQEAAKRKEKEIEPPKRKNDITRLLQQEAVTPHDNNKETVTISKDYLEQLLRQNFTRDSETNKYNSLPSPKPRQTAPNSERKTSSSPSKHHHVEVDHSQIPGLEDYNGHKTTNKRHYSPVDTTVQPPPKEEERHYEEMVIPYVSHESPRHGESYHRGTMNRPVHPAMRSSINFGGEGRGGECGDYRWHPRANPPQKPSNYTNEKRKSEDRDFPCPSIKVQHHDPLPYEPSPRSSMNLFQSQNDENRMKELIYREELRLQIEENKRLREEERIKREIENRREEERVEQERQRLAREFEIEKEKQRRKEIEASQKLATLYQKTQEVMKVTKEREKRTKFKQPDNKTTESFSNLAITQVDFDLRSPSMLPALPEISNKSPQRSPRRSLLPVRKNLHLSGSQISLHSTSSEEPAAAMKTREVGGGGGTYKGGHNKGTMIHKVATGGSESTKTSSGLVKETRVQRRQTIKKQMNSKKSDSESEWNQQERPLKPPRGGGGVSGGNRTLPNSIARSTKQALHRSLKEPNHNRIVRLRSEPTNIESSPDCHMMQNRPHHQSPPHSPPVPALAKRLAMEQNNVTKTDNDIHDLLDSDMTNPHVPVESLQNNKRLPSIPVIHSATSKAQTVVVSESTIHMLPPLANSCHIINRAPSCSPDNQPLSGIPPPSNKSIVLPPIIEVRSREEREQQESIRMASNTCNNNSQREQIMHSLSKLKQNIVSHTNDVSNKVKTVL